MPRLTGCRNVAKRFLQDLRGRRSLEHGSIIPTTDAPAIQEHDEVDAEPLQAAHLWNQSLPVNQLPNELLIRIFLLLVSRGKGTHNPAWVKLMLVCRYWRDVALATPGIWRSIDIGLNADWTDLALTRSDPATIDIYMRPKYISREQFRLIYPHAHRIRRLRFYDSIDPQWSAALHTLFDPGMPALETLTLSINPNRWPKPVQSTYIDIQLSSKQSPRLQMLSLSHVVMPRDPLLLSKLHTLTLKKCECDYSLDQFLDILSSCSMLRKLCLLSFLNNLTGNWPSHPIAQRPPISLPQIVAVVLGHHPPRHSSHFLAHLLLPATTHLVVHAGVPIHGQEDSTHSLLDVIPPNRTTVLPVLRAVTKAELHARRNGYYLRGATLRSGEKYPLELGYHPALNNPWDTGPGRRDLLLRGLADLVSVFQVAALRCLSIRGLSVAVTHAKWKEVLDAFPRLKELRVNDDGPMVALVGALQSESSLALSSTPGHDAGRRSNSMLPCPQLRFLALELECDMYGPFLDMVLDCVHRRAEKGSQLNKLELRSFSPADAVEEDWTPFVRGLEGLVPDVCYIPQPDAILAIALLNSVLLDS